MSKNRVIRIGSRRPKMDASVPAPAREPTPPAQQALLLLPPPAAPSPAPAPPAAPPEYVVTPFGCGQLVAVREGVAQVRLQFGLLFCPEGALSRELSLHVRGFFRGGFQAQFPVSVASPLRNLVGRLALQCGVKEEDVRLVYKGRELTPASNKTMVDCNLPSPCDLLMILDEKAKFALDEAHCGDDIEILSDRVSATIHINNKWRSSSNMFIGVCADGFDVNNYCGKDGFSYGLYGCSNVYHMAASRKYGETVHTGDVVRVLLDQDRRTLHYELNGTPLGLAFDNLPAVVYPCFSLYTVDDEFTVENYSTF